MLFVYVEHPMAPDRPFVAVVEDLDAAIDRFGRASTIYELPLTEVLVIEKDANRMVEIPARR